MNMGFVIGHYSHMALLLRELLAYLKHLQYYFIHMKQ
jgi:hypothetical protein